MKSGSELEDEAIDTVEQQVQSKKITTSEVINYLTANPDFFNQNRDLVASLEIPHVADGAISLIERQVSILREQNNQQQASLNELIDIAKDNEQSNQRMHQLTLALISCNGIDACEVIMDEHLCHDFLVDAVALKLFIEPIAEQPDHIFAQGDSLLTQELEKLLNTRKPMCGFFKQLPLETLFDNKSQAIASLAVIPLFVEKNNCFGAMVLGSKNARRFNADMGTIFLERLGEILSQRLDAFIRNSSKTNV